MTTVRPEPIGTSRLVLVPIEPGPLDEMAEVLADPALYAWLGRQGVGEVIAHIHPDHHASAAVAAAAGLSPADDWHDGERCWRRVITPAAAGP